MFHSKVGVEYELNPYTSLFVILQNLISHLCLVYSKINHISDRWGKKLKSITQLSNYQIIGQGGFGKVYLGQHSRKYILIVLKIQESTNFKLKLKIKLKIYDFLGVANPVFSELLAT